ncbi:MAG: PTS sugar transporter subunit IIA [Pseudomonadota bacterium]
MHLTDVLRPDMVWHELKATTKMEVIDELAKNISASMGSLDAKTLADIITEREKLGSTGIQDGIAIPHGKVPGLEKIIVACGRSSRGIEFDAHDAKPTHLFFVLLAPEFAAGQHLKALARLSRLLKDARFREGLLAAADANEMYKAISEEDRKI